MFKLFLKKSNVRFYLVLVLHQAHRGRFLESNGANTITHRNFCGNIKSDPVKET